MPDIENGSFWPALLKYSDEFRHLFPRIEGRDRELENILSDCLPNEESQYLEGDLIEASRRLREAVKHDAYLRWTPADTKKLAKVFVSLEKAHEVLSSLTSHQHKAILRAVVAKDDGQTSLETLRYRIGLTLLERDKISCELEHCGDVRKTTARTATRPFSLIERLAEAWKVMSGNEPSMTFSNNDSEPGPFERCLQRVGEHLNLQAYNKRREFRARSALQAYEEHKPPPDNT